MKHALLLACLASLGLAAPVARGASLQQPPVVAPSTPPPESVRPADARAGDLWHDTEDFDSDVSRLSASQHGDAPSEADEVEWSLPSPLEAVERSDTRDEGPDEDGLATPEE
ncbi:hypothetical protein CDD83_9500 [Cordyceps sp. RAO-2017]|nr:hypothetical protein CDD83_9500 [Cordyceps sp. RAO-2017]